MVGRCFLSFWGPASWRLWTVSFGKCNQPTTWSSPSPLPSPFYHARLPRAGSLNDVFGLYGWISLAANQVHHSINCQTSYHIIWPSHRIIETYIDVYACVHKIKAIKIIILVITMIYQYVTSYTRCKESKSNWQTTPAGWEKITTCYTPWKTHIAMEYPIFNRKYIFKGSIFAMLVYRSVTPLLTKASLRSFTKVLLCFSCRAWNQPISGTTKDVLNLKRKSEKKTSNHIHDILLCWSFFENSGWVGVPSSTIQ